MTTQVTPNRQFDSLADLRSSFRGELISSGDPAYELVRKSLLWNGMHNRRPALIARCTGASEVQAALGYARSQNLGISAW